jgi:hypothetical protein
MLRPVLFAVLFAGLLAAAQPTVADPLAATAPAHVQAAAAIAACTLPALGAGAEHGIAPAGFGWG